MCNKASLVSLVCDMMLHKLNRVHTGPGKPGKSWNFKCMEESKEILGE